MQSIMNIRERIFLFSFPNKCINIWYLEAAAGWFFATYTPMGMAKAMGYGGFTKGCFVANA